MTRNSGNDPGKVAHLGKVVGGRVQDREGARPDPSDPEGAWCGGGGGPSCGTGGDGSRLAREERPFLHLWLEAR